MHPVYVFVRRSKDGITVPVKKMNNTGWRSARERAADAWERVHGTVAPQGFRRVRVHDLKHYLASLTMSGSLRRALGQLRNFRLPRMIAPPVTRHSFSFTGC